jgi:hypothetical protein
MDIVDPLGIRKIPAAVRDKVDSYIDEKTQAATTMASQKVTAGVRQSVNEATTRLNAGLEHAATEAGSKMGFWLAGLGIAATVAAGGAYLLLMKS